MNMRKLLYIATACSVFTSYCANTNQSDKKAKVTTVVIIDDIPRKFDPKTSCAVQSWANKLQNACKCCLIKQSHDFLRGVKATAIINECITSSSCNQDLIEQFLQENKIARTIAEEEQLHIFLDAFYKQTILVREVLPDKLVVFDEKGYFKTSSIGPFLAQAFSKGLISNQDFSKAECISAENIRGEGGFQTKQLFAITASCADISRKYILKETLTGPSEEIYRLAQSTLLPDIKAYVYPNSEPGYPIFVMPATYFSYEYAGKEHFLVLLPTAPGIKLSSLMQAYKDNPSQKTAIEKAFYDTGHALAMFHKKFMEKYKDKAISGKILQPTLVHGDAHQANVFYDAQSSRVFFIDNERIASSSPKDPTWEIRYFFFTTLDLFTPASLKKDMNFVNEWLALIIKSFIDGYINAYDSKEKITVLDELYNSFKASSSYQRYKEIIDTVFGELKTMP